MKGSLKIISLMAVISLLLGVIWLPLSFAATVPTFASLGMLGTKGQGAAGDYASPMGIAMDAAGNFYVTDGSVMTPPRIAPNQDRIIKLDTYGNKIAEFASLELSGPIAVKSDGSEIYVAIGASDNGPGGGPGVDGVLVYDGATGVLKRSVGANNGPDGRGEFVAVADIKLDSNGWLYIADAGAGEVKVYDPSEAYQYSIGAVCVGNGSSNACEAGEFSSITSMALDEANGELFVADRSSLAYSPTGTDTGNIQVFDLQSRTYKRVMLETQMGGPISSTTSFSEYYGLALDGQGRFYVTYGQLGALRAMDTSIAYPADAFLAGFDLGSAAYRSVYDSVNRRLVFSGDQGLIVVGIDGGSNPVAQNDAPPVPTQVSPVADTVVATAAPSLDFSAVTDPNGDAVSYQVSLAQVGQAAVVYDVPAGATSYVAGGLVENAQYAWKVQAVDAKGAVSGWSAEGTFWVNAVNEAPSVPQLVSPLNGELLGPYDMLKWQLASDPDPANKVRYRLSLSPTADFSASVLEEIRWGKAVPLQKLSNYLNIVAGTTYFWRLEALDGKGGWSQVSASGSFVLKATDLRVDTNMPGTRVYLAGNRATHGRYLGMTPLVVRNPRPLGMNELVFERAGFEPLVKTVYVKPLAAKSLSYSMSPALTPQVGPVLGYRFYYRGQNSSGQTVSFFLGTQVKDLRSAFVVNIDRRGGEDLVSVRQDGAVVFFSEIKKASWGGTRYKVNASQVLLPAGSASSLFAVDWKNVGRIDLLAGGSDGRLRIYHNSGRTTPLFDQVPEVLQVNGQDLVFGSNPVPAVIDWDGDGLNDLLVGDDTGKLYFVQNVGTLNAPVFVAPVVVFQSTVPVAPCMTDWDGDGAMEFLFVDDKGVSLYEQQGAGLVYIETLPLKYQDGRTFDAKVNTRIFVMDLDGAGGKDLIMVDGLGRFMVASSSSSQHVSSFQPALLVKTDQVQTLVDAQAPAQSNQVGAVRAAIQSAQNDDYTAASLEVDNLLAGLDPAGSAYAAASELKQLLQ
ncbi:hypothetical protein C2E25_11190 [Geothermobacter hydrogeniphilus]|uniref:Fibronectin type-III domain-containing protein n=1 Tax=Geothermobacter hydrogeniphilus TaxID=1969733 RepID=A0A2K2H8R9_9BACT|nr:FG-GAP-like repeat-containing protein [Geothermobacter hydrogeniphilus]PNU19661.1 hypothetical protein C2E25_11190 [Geothermobacter hydrogeniphilus]